MSRKHTTIVSIGAALASLGGAQALSVGAQADTLSDDVNSSKASNQGATSQLTWNAHFQVGEDLMGFVMTQRPDGTLVAQHGSHASHASHHSHASHASSRY
jgi:hypothetical protein